MKRRWLSKSVVIIVMMFCLVGCGDSKGSSAVLAQPQRVEVQNDAGTPAIEDAEAYHAISVTEIEPKERELLYRVFYFDPDGTNPEDDELVYEYAYDESGRLLDEKEYKHDIVYFEDRYEYNEAGELINKIHYFKGDPYFQWEYEYDVSGYLVRKNRYGLDGNIDFFAEYENDSSGNLVKEAYYEGDGSITGSAEYAYDESGNLLKEVHYGEDGSIVNSTEFTYDESGNLTEENSYKVTYHDIYEDRVEYVYDASGNLLRETSFTDGRFFHYNDYVYDSDGNIARKEVHYISSLDGSDTLNNYYEYTCDKAGALLTSVIYDRDGNVFYDTVNEEFLKGYRYEYITVEY